MPTLTPDAARAFAAQWVAAWNRHDLPAILAHYAEELVFASPLVRDIAGEASGVLRGKAAVGAYWAKGLALLPDLRFELVDVLCGVDALTLYYRGHRGMVAETLRFGAEGKVVEGRACYACAPGEAG